MAHLNPTPDQVRPKIGAARDAFTTKYADNIRKGMYDEHDLERLRNDDKYVSCFLRTLKAKGDPQKAAEVVHESFKFRKEFGLNGLTEKSFPAELTDRKAVYYKGQDINGFPILYVAVKEDDSKGENQQLLKQYIAWSFEQHQKKTPEQMVVVLFDMTGTGVSNINTDIVKFLITCFTTYFPAFLAYMINYNLPTLLSAAFSIVSTFLNAEQKQKLLNVRKEEIGKFLAVEHQWPHMALK